MPRLSAESSPSTAILLIAHGSRRASANADLVRLATLIGERNDFAAIEMGFL